MGRLRRNKKPLNVISKIDMKKGGHRAIVPCVGGCSQCPHIAHRENTKHVSNATPPVKWVPSPLAPLKLASHIGKRSLLPPGPLGMHQPEVLPQGPFLPFGAGLASHVFGRCIRQHVDAMTQSTATAHFFSPAGKYDLGGLESCVHPFTIALAAMQEEAAEIGASEHIRGCADTAAPFPRGAARGGRDAERVLQGGEGGGRWPQPREGGPHPHGQATARWATVRARGGEPSGAHSSALLLILMMGTKV